MGAAPTREDLPAACDGLVRLWHTRGAITPDGQLDRYHEARLVTVSALAAHAYRAGEVGDYLIGKGLWLESAPIIRTSYECAITATWAAQVPDSVEAILNEDHRSRRSMAATIERSAWASEPGVSVPDPDDQDYATLSSAQAQRFLQMCDDLSPGGAEAYAVYRTMCWFSHPTNYIVDSYAELVGGPDGAERLKLRRTPLSSDGQADLFQFVCAASMVIAASALNHLDVEKSHEASIAEYAARIGVSAEMKVTERALKRVSRSD